MLIQENLQCRLEALANEIKERETGLNKLYSEHWLYAMQKQTLEDKKREYLFLQNQGEQNG